MGNLPPTREEVAPASDTPAPATPGVLVVFAGGVPTLRAFRLARGRLKLGRAAIDDELVSRDHCEIEWTAGQWRVRDLGSTNGTYVDGERVDGLVTGDIRVIRLGHTLCVPVADVRGERVERRGDMVVGPTLAAVLDRVERAARLGDTLLLQGESGAGKELAAQTFHRAGSGSSGPFVAVNCAAIPEGVAERLLFGARKGAFSGADADAEGYVQAADGGTLFLDEVAELDAPVQAKLLRVLENREVLALGAAKPSPVDLRVVSATNVALRDAVSRGAFREDLYFRIGQPSVELPALRDRREEIPHLIAHALGERLRPHARFVEECMLRPWPGNVRELLGEVARAGHAAAEAGRDEIVAADLAADAGAAFQAETGKDSTRAAPDRVAIEAALRAADGNVSAAARALGVHRTQLRRWIDKLGLR